MAKQIKVSDEIYERLKELADKNYRSIGGQIDFMMDNLALGNNVETGTPSGFVADLVKAPEKKSGANAPVTTPRGKGEILADIRELEAQRDEELRYCQDVEYGKAITARYADQLDVLWKEYNSLTEAV